MPPDLFVARCRAKGLTVIEMTVDGKNWKDNNRNAVGPWSDLYGITEHHTGSDTTDPFNYAKFLFRGSSALIGPLCQWSTAPNGDIYMIGWGRCNHAGGGDPIVLAALKAETVPLDRELKPTKGNSDGVDGNRAMYGNEIMYSGGHPMTAAQLKSSLVTDVVICEYHGWTGASVIGHREWSDDKPDPGFQNMAEKRRMVNTALSGGSTGGDDVVTEAEMDRIAEKSAYKTLTWEQAWVDPITGTVSPPWHPKTSLALMNSWNEEYTYRFAKQWSEKTVAAIAAIIKALPSSGALTEQQITDAVSKALAEQMNFSGTLTLTPEADSPSAPEAYDPKHD